MARSTPAMLDMAESAGPEGSGDLIDENMDEVQQSVTSDNQLLCSVCESADIYEVLSSCLHPVCRNCVDELCKDDSYRCKLCGEVSKETISNPNLSVPESSTKSPNCNWCEDNGEQTVSVGHCKDCDIWLCSECVKGHNRMPPLRSHVMNMLPKSKNRDSLRCQAHPHETLECFCEACGVLTCRDCQLSIHRDHGSHRWVGEKAAQLKIPLEEAIQNLEQTQKLLSSASEMASKARLDTDGDSFISSVEKARQDIQSRADLLIQSIRSRTDSLLKELDSKSKSSTTQLENAELLFQKLDDQMTFSIVFAKRLIQHMDNDPASLVQLYDAVKKRMDLLRDRSTNLLGDSPPSDKSRAQILANKSDLNEWCKSAVGWRDTVNTRALFLTNCDPKEIARHSGLVTWLPISSNIPLSKTFKSTIEKDTKDIKSIHDNLNESTNDFLDSLVEIDKQDWTNDSNSSSPVLGCAVCFGVGLLANCGKCKRAFHLECHLPRLNKVTLSSDWTCSLCRDPKSSASMPVDSPNSCGLSQEDYLIGCRIFMNLLVHSEAIHFTASVCPACSSSLLDPERTNTHCPAGHLYHRLAELRLQLEKAGRVQNMVSNGCTETTLNGDGEPPILKPSRLITLDDWLAELDKFWSDVIKENGIRGATKGCLHAARSLRDHLSSLVQLYRPDSHLASPTEVADESMRDDPTQLSSLTPPEIRVKADPGRRLTPVKLLVGAE